MPLTSVAIRLLTAIACIVSASPADVAPPSPHPVGMSGKATTAISAFVDVSVPGEEMEYEPNQEEERPDDQKPPEPSADGWERDVNAPIGLRIAELGASLCMSAVNDGNDYPQILRNLGLYGTSPGQYTYSGGRFQGHLGSKTDSTAPDSRMPNAERYIAFTMRRRSDGSTPPGGGLFADCSVMPANLCDYFGLSFSEFAEVAHKGLKLPKYGGRGEKHGESFETEHYLWIPCDSGRSFDEQCQPGDILCNGVIPHYMLYVGNEIAQEHFPGTTGNVCEAGHRSQSFWGITDCGYSPNADWLICRPKE